MIRLAIVAEGETEGEFVRSLLAPHLLGRGVIATAPLLGGGVSIDRLAREMANCASQFERVTSLVDLYRFRGGDGASAGELERRVDGEIARRLRRGSNPEHVFTYIQQHEVAEAIGLERIRGACPRFGGWLTRLESLAGGPPPRSPAA